MAGFGFNINNDKKTFEQSKQDVAFEKGKVTKKSKIMASPMFMNTITQYGVDAAKTIILQEFMNMSTNEIKEEVDILSKVAEENNDIKRSLRAAKFLAVQWMEDERRSADIKQKCEFIIEIIPTFKNAPNKPLEKKTMPVIPSQEELLHIKDDIVEEVVVKEEIIIPEVKNKPQPFENPPKAVLVKSGVINQVKTGEQILLITDVQGDFFRLRDTLLKYKVIYPDKNIFRWNKDCKTKLVITGDLFNKSPYSSWGGQAVYQSFQVLELIRRLHDESKNNVFITLSNYDIKLASEQVFRDSVYGFCNNNFGTKVQAQAIPAMVSFLENTAFDNEDNIYSLWKKDTSSGQLFFKLKPEFLIEGLPDLKIKANELYMPDIGSIRGLLQNIYHLLNQPKDKRPKDLKDLDNKIKTLIKPREGEDISALLDSKKRALFFEGILKGSETLDFLKKVICSTHKFQTDKRENLTFAHVSLQNEYAQFFEKAKEANFPSFEMDKYFSEAKFLKMRKISPEKFASDLKKAGYSNLQEFITASSEDIFELLSSKSMLESFIPSISPNKVKFGFVKSFELVQNSLKQEDKTGLLGFRIVDRNLDSLDDANMKKISELDKSSKEAYSEKFLTDIFGNAKAFKLTHTEDKKVLCQKPNCTVELEIDKNSALYEDEKKSIQVPIKHIALIKFS